MIKVQLFTNFCWPLNTLFMKVQHNLRITILRVFQIVEQETKKEQQIKLANLKARYVNVTARDLVWLFKAEQRIDNEKQIF